MVTATTGILDGFSSNNSSLILYPLIFSHGLVNNNRMYHPFSKTFPNVLLLINSSIAFSFSHRAKTAICLINILEGYRIEATNVMEFIYSICTKPSIFFDFGENKIIFKEVKTETLTK